MTEFEMETIYRIHSRDGYFFEVTTDPDGLNCVEIRYYESTKDKGPDRIVSIPSDALGLLIQSLQKMEERING